MTLHAEDKVHIAVKRWIDRHSPCICWHTPNGGSRHMLEAMRLKQLGVMPGVADLFVLPPDGVPTFVEVKAAKGRQSPEQRAFQRKVESYGARYGIARSVEEAIALFAGWGLPFTKTLWSGGRAA